MPQRSLVVWFSMTLVCCCALLGACTTPWPSEVQWPDTGGSTAGRPRAAVSEAAAGERPKFPVAVTAALKSDGPRPLLTEDKPQQPAGLIGHGEVEPVPPGAMTGAAAPGASPDATAAEAGRSGFVPGQAASIEEVLQYALHHHPLLRVRQGEVEAARGKLIAAGLLPNPQIVMDTETPHTEAGPTDLTTRVEFTFPLGPKLKLRTAAAQTAVREKQLALNYEVKLVLAEAADAAMEVLYCQELVALQRHLSELAGKEAEVQRERFNVAAVTYRNMVIAGVAAANVELAHRDALTMLELAQVRLARAMGLSEPCPPAMHGQLVAEPIPLAPVGAILAEARKVAPELAQSLAAVAENQQLLALARWTALPDLTFGPRMQNRLSKAQPEDRVGARVAMNVPIFDRNQGGIAETAGLLQTARAQVDVIEINTLNDVAAAYMELGAVQSTLRYYESDVSPLIEDTEKALHQAFEDRAVAAYEVVDLLQQFAKMRMAHLALRYRFNRLRARLEIILERRLATLPGAAEFRPAPPADIVPPPLEE